MKLFRLSGYMLALILFSGSVLAQEKLNQPGNSTPSKTMQALELAADLLDYGQQNTDAMSLILAAKILQVHPVSEAPATRVTVEGREVSDKETREKETVTLSFDADEILAEARSYAGGDELLLELISQLETTSRGPAARGYRHGYINAVHKIPANGSKTFRWEFSGNEKAEIMFAGDGDTNLDFFVYDEDGTLLQSDESLTDMVSWNWIPSSTKEYIFKVVNQGDVYNNCRIVSN